MTQSCTEYFIVFFRSSNFFKFIIFIWWKEKCALKPIKMYCWNGFLAKSVQIKHPFILIKLLSQMECKCRPKCSFQLFVQPINLLDFYRHDYMRLSKYQQEKFFQNENKTHSRTQSHTYTNFTIRQILAS